MGEVYNFLSKPVFNSVNYLFQFLNPISVLENLYITDILYYTGMSFTFFVLHNEYYNFNEPILELHDDSTFFSEHPISAKYIQVRSKEWSINSKGGFLKELFFSTSTTVVLCEESNLHVNLHVESVLNEHFNKCIELCANYEKMKLNLQIQSRYPYTDLMYYERPEHRLKLNHLCHCLRSERNNINPLVEINFEEKRQYSTKILNKLDFKNYKLFDVEIHRAYEQKNALKIDSFPEVLHYRYLVYHFFKFF